VCEVARAVPCPACKVDDGYRDALAARLRADGLHVEHSVNRGSLLARFESVGPALVLLGSAIADERTVLELARELRQDIEHLGIILLVHARVGGARDRRLRAKV
jgi:hypothetical protein